MSDKTNKRVSNFDFRIEVDQRGRSEAICNVCQKRFWYSVEPTIDQDAAYRFTDALSVHECFKGRILATKQKPHPGIISTRPER